MRTAKANNPLEQVIVDNIRRFGWHCTSVGFDVDSAVFAYTIGLFKSYRHPELLVFGLPPRTAHGMFVAAAGAIADGRTLTADEPVCDVLGQAPCLPISLEPTQYAEFALSACWYYRGRPFPLLQIVWPSEDGVYPWHPRATEAFRAIQPVLSRIDYGCV